MQEPGHAEDAPSDLPLSRPASVALIVASSTATALAVLTSPWGSIFFLDDLFTRAAIVAPIVAGLLVGALQTAAFGARLTLVTVAATTALASCTLLLAYPAVMHLLGVALGTALASSGRHLPAVRRGAALLLASITLGALAYGIPVLTAPEPPLVDLVEGSGHPTVVLEPGTRAPEILDPVTGVLVDVGGCLGLASRDGGTERHRLVFWPESTEVRTEPFVVSWEGRTYGLGDRLTIRAAVLERREGDHVHYADELPDGCEPFDILMT